MTDRAVRFDYLNYRGELAERCVIPLSVWFGSTEWHKTAQWLLRAHDLDKGTIRDFAIVDIKNWRTT